MSELYHYQHDQGYRTCPNPTYNTYNQQQSQMTYDQYYAWQQSCLIAQQQPQQTVTFTVPINLAYPGQVCQQIQLSQAPQQPIFFTGYLPMNLIPQNVIPPTQQQAPVYQYQPQQVYSTPQQYPQQWCSENQQSQLPYEDIQNLGSVDSSTKQEKLSQSLDQSFISSSQQNKFQKQQNNQLQNKHVLINHDSNLARNVLESKYYKHQTTIRNNDLLSLKHDLSNDNCNSSTSNPINMNDSKNDSKSDSKSNSSKTKSFSLKKKQICLSKSSDSTQPDSDSQQPDQNDISCGSANQDQIDYHESYKKNVVKNFVKGFTRYITNSENVSELLDTLQIDEDKLKFIRKRVSQFIKRRNFNNMLIIDLLKHPIFSNIFEYFLINKAKHWLETSQVLDRASHLKMLSLFINMIHEPQKRDILMIDKKSRRYKK